MARIFLFDAEKLGAHQTKPYLRHSHVEVDDDGVAYLVVEGSRMISTLSLSELLRRLCLDERMLAAAATA